tara:strand:+ start:255 stop:575 length:321 start_codon:yes stop_codon:yes gene_type:complete
MVKQSIIINGRTLSWDVPDKVIKKKKKKKRRQKRKEPNNFRAVIKTNFVKYLEEYHTKDFTTFLEEFPFFSLDTPVLIDESEKNYFQQEYEKNLRNMIKAVGHIEI